MGLIFWEQEMSASEAASFDPDSENMLVRWTTNCKRSQIANYEAAAHYSKRNKCLGIPTVICSSIVGAGIFSNVGNSNADQGVQILVGFISIFAATLAALQTFLQFGDNAAKCRVAAAEYGALKREIDQLLVACRSQRLQLDENTVSQIRSKMDTLSRDSPSIPEDIWERARTIVPLAKS
jgi:hypothetical protein